MNYKGYDITKDGTIKKDGKLIATGRIYLNGSWHNGIDLANKLYEAPIKETALFTPKQVDKTANKLKHGNTGRKHSIEAIQRMKEAKQKSIEIEGVTYKSITAATEVLNCNRSTIYRKLKDVKNPAM